MKTYLINGKPFDFDETKEYRDFFLTEGKPGLYEVDFANMLGRLADGWTDLDQVAEELVMLDRWVYEAPRKRFYRGLKLSGAVVLSNEYWFEHREDGEQIIDALEATGHVARRFLETFLPELAFQCKGKVHPASVTYIDP